MDNVIGGGGEFLTHCKVILDKVVKLEISGINYQVSGCP